MRTSVINKYKILHLLVGVKCTDYFTDPLIIVQSHTREQDPNSGFFVFTAPDFDHDVKMENLLSMPKDDNKRFRDYFNSMESKVNALQEALDNHKKRVREEVKRRFNWAEDNNVPHLYSGATDERTFKTEYEEPGAIYSCYVANCVQTIRINPKEVQKFEIRVKTKPFMTLKFHELGMPK